MANALNFTADWTDSRRVASSVSGSAAGRWNWAPLTCFALTGLLVLWFVIADWLATPESSTTVIAVTAFLAMGLGTVSLVRAVNPSYAPALLLNVLIDGFFLWLVFSGRLV